MQSTAFRARRIGRIHSQWQAIFIDYWPAYKTWYRQKMLADITPQALKLAHRQLAKIMPEMLPLYEDFREVSNDCPIAAQFLTGYRPPAYLVNCSQAVLLEEEPLLMRNYDLSPALSENLVTQSDWLDQEIIGTNECLWGLDDGMNRSGLAASLTFGGSNKVGKGFGIPFIMRYLLQTCESVKQGIRLLQRVPSHMAYNVTLLDRHGAFATVMLAPDRTAIVTREACITNHQTRVTWPQQARFSQTLERKRLLDELLAREDTKEAQLRAAFLNPPLHSTNYARDFGTVFTAVYKPSSETMSYYWPGEQEWRHGFAGFRDSEKIVTLGLPANLARIQGKTIRHSATDHWLSADIRQQLVQGLEYLPASAVAQPAALIKLKLDLQTKKTFSWQQYAQLLAQIWRYPVSTYEL